MKSLLFTSIATLVLGSSLQAVTAENFARAVSKHGSQAIASHKRLAKLHEKMARHHKEMTRELPEMGEHLDVAAEHHHAVAKEHHKMAKLGGQFLQEIEGDDARTEDDSE